MTYSVSVPPRLVIGGGSLDSIGEVVSGLGASRPLVVTDGFLAGNGVADRVKDILASAGLAAEVFSGTVPDPTSVSLDAGVAAVKDHDADAVIGLGGGSPIDTAKALAVLSVRGGSMHDLKAPVKYDGPALPVIAVPTTAGTGSEATQVTVITDTETDEKMMCAGPSYLPKAAVVDHELTHSMPRRLTADTGIDAMTHAVEAYVSKQRQGFSDAMALQALATIGKSLRRCVENGADVEARAAMMEAATFAGIAFSNSSVALVHAMSRPIGGHFHVAHGMANAMLFPAVTEFSLGMDDDRYAACARALGVAGASETDADAARLLVDFLKQVSADFDVPTPESFGIERDEWFAKIPLMAQQAIASGSHANNPRVPSAEEIEAIYAKIYS
ncbi:MAG: iron-containing alcohol dehydrogenase [Galactobacter sp.]